MDPESLGLEELYAEHQWPLQQARVELTLYVDGSVIDLNRIRLPGDTPIVDGRAAPQDETKAK